MTSHQVNGVLGPVMGAATNLVAEIAGIISWTNLAEAVTVSAVGAATGYLVKEVFNRIFKPKNKE